VEGGEEGYGKGVSVAGGVRVVWEGEVVVEGGEGGVDGVGRGGGAGEEDGGEVRVEWEGEARGEGEV
ncbi:hypothetical protein, partial [Kocuria rhizophila]|uniref:hypothetical protein n=1 Tax=Kocuria rhizophila TaxID=72000 RepID=UPI001C930BCB